MARLTWLSAFRGGTLAVRIGWRRRAFSGVVGALAGLGLGASLFACGGPQGRPTLPPPEYEEPPSPQNAAPTDAGNGPAQLPTDGGARSSADSA